MKGKTIHIEGIGKILLKESIKAKQLNITILPFRGVRVSVPLGVNFSQAEIIVQKKKTWIKKHLTKMQSVENNYTRFDEKTEFSTHSHKLIIEKWEKAISFSRVFDGKILVKYPDKMNVYSDAVQSKIRKAIERAWRNEAKEYLPTRVHELVQEHRFKIKGVSVKNIKTRWGSCSKDNNINLSIHLMRLPSHLIDYVICHELCHTVYKDHSPKYWQLLNNAISNPKKLDKEVKEWNIQIY